MLHLEVTLSGNAADGLRKAMSRIANLRPLLDGFGSKLVVSFQGFINTSTTPTGKKYPPLKRPRGAGHNPDPTPLIDTRALLEDLRYEITAADTVKAGSTLPYAVYQNKGTRTIPARTFIGISPEIQDQFTEDMRAFIQTAFTS